MPNDDERGFVLSGIALLLILPVMLLAASSLLVINIGGKATSLQSVADKVHTTGLDAEDTIEWMYYQGLPVDDLMLDEIANNYESSTGLELDIYHNPDNWAIIHIIVQDPLGSAYYVNNLKL